MSRERRALEQLAEANPVIQPDVEELLPAIRARIPVAHVPPVAAPRPRRRRLRVALAAAALALVLAVVAPALGLRLPVLDFFSAEPAPREVVLGFETLSRDSPPGMDPGVIPGETRRVGTFRVSGSARTLWVAPTEAGGFCTMWERMGGGCDRLGTVPLDVFWSRGIEPGFVHGHVSSRFADGVELRFTDGSSVQPEVTWVSEPIAAGFFAHDLPSDRLLESVVGLDAAGEAVSTSYVNPRAHQDAVHPDALADQRRPALRVAAEGGEVVLWEAPTRYEGTCAWLEFQGHVRDAGCRPEGHVNDGSAIGFVATASDLILWGRVQERAERLEVRFADGGRASVEPRNGFVLYAVPRARLVEGRLPSGFSLVARDGSRLMEAPVEPWWLCASSADGGCPIPGLPVGGPLERGSPGSAEALCSRFAREAAELDLSSRSLAALEPELRRLSLLRVELTTQLQAVEPPRGEAADYHRFVRLHERQDYSLRFLAQLAQDRREDAFWGLAERWNEDVRELERAAAEIGLEICVPQTLQIGPRGR
jgi:hypothetical protein